MTIRCVTLIFDAESVVPATIEIVGDETRLDGFLRARAEHPAWQWVREQGDALAFHVAPHLLQRIDARYPSYVCARYLFDGVHAAAHPELIDREHVDILHGTMAAKILDEGAIVLEPDGIASSLHWVSTERTGVRLTRDGSRSRGRS